MGLFRQVVAGIVLAAISCTAGAVVNAELRTRYESLKQRYQVLQKIGADLRALRTLVESIENAKQAKDFGRLESLLGDLDRQLLPLEHAPENSPGATLSMASPLPQPANSQVGKQFSEYEMAKALFGVPEFRQLLRSKAEPLIVNGSGAVGRNVADFTDVAAQRDAGWLMLMGLADADAVYVEKAIRAVEYAFEHQHPQGYFQNGLGVAASKAVNADTFFLQAYGRIYWLLKASSFKGAYLSRLDGLNANLQRALTWLRHNTDEMRRQDGKTANRLAFDALAFLLNGKILGDSALMEVGIGFLNDVLALQTPQGFFLEKGGYDSSYQAVTLMNLAAILPVLDSENLRQETILSMGKGQNWLKSRILANGQVSAIGNTRTGEGQETFFGKTKDINYAEVAMSLFSWSVIADDQQAQALARNVVNFARQASRF